MWSDLAAQKTKRSQLIAHRVERPSHKRSGGSMACADPQPAGLRRLGLPETTHRKRRNRKASGGAKGAVPASRGRRLNDRPRAIRAAAPWDTPVLHEHGDDSMPALFGMSAYRHGASPDRRHGGCRHVAKPERGVISARLGVNFVNFRASDVLAGGGESPVMRARPSAGGL